MIKVSVEIRSVAGSFRVNVWAEGVVQAIDLANSYYPGCKARVLFPIDSEAFFTKDPVPTTGVVSPETLEAAG